MSRSIKILPDIAGLFCLSLFVGLVLTAGKKALGDADTLWHIKSGSIMLERGALLTQDIFSHTAYGKPWTAHEWLAEIIMAALHKIGGLPAVVIFFFLLVAFTFWLLFKIANLYAGEWISFLTVLTAFLLSRIHLLARPHLFTWLFGVSTLYLLSKGGRGLYFLPIITALWANLHGGVVLGLLLQGIFLVGHILERGSMANFFRQWKEVVHENKKSLLILLCSILAVGINPFGYQLFLFQFHVTQSAFSQGIVEWRSPDFQELWFFRGYILLIIVILLFQTSRTTWTNRLLLLFFINAALTHVRHVSLVGFFLTPFFACSLESIAQNFNFLKRNKNSPKDLLLSPASGPIATLTLFALIFAASASANPGWQKVINEVISLPEQFPNNTALFLKQHQPTGNLFNDYSLGGYLIYALDPPPPVFIDGRADMYGAKIFEDYQKIAKLDKEADELLTKYNIDWVVFPSGRPLTQYLKVGGSWREVYIDDHTAVLVRNQLPPQNRPDAHVAEE